MCVFMCVPMCVSMVLRRRTRTSGVQEPLRIERTYARCRCVLHTYTYVYKYHGDTYLRDEYIHTYINTYLIHKCTTSVVDVALSFITFSVC